MNKKILALIGLLLIPAIFLTGCASGLTASSWSGMTADANNVYVAAGQFVYAVNLQTGAKVWSYPDKASSNPFYAAPALSADGKQLIVGGFDKKLYSLDVQTGKSLWTFTQARDRWIGGALVTDKMIYAPNADYNLYALDLQGNQKWLYTADESIWGMPVTDGTNVYFGTLGRKVYALNADTGKLAWVTPVDGAVLGSPVLGKDSTLYVGTYSGKVYAINTASGASQVVKQTSSWIWNGPSMDGDNLYVGDGSGNLYAFPLATSGQSWTQTLNGAVTSTPLVNGQNVIVGTEKGSVYLISLDGKTVKPIALTSNAKVYATPIKAGDLTLVAPTGGDDIVLALDQNGAIKWHLPVTK